MSETWHFIPESSGSPGWNMAFDEALLESASEHGVPVLRFYSWSEPAASFGYFQKYKEVEKLTALRPLVRRPTAGGLVPHDLDWTYSIAFPPTHSWYGFSAIESYRSLHEWVQNAFARLNVPSSLAPCCIPSGPGQCFVGAEKFDLLFSGKKIAGAAQRRNKSGLLIQGSVQQQPPGILRADWEKSMLEVSPAGISVGWESFPLPPLLLRRAAELVEQKYSHRWYHQKR